MSQNDTSAHTKRKAPEGAFPATAGGTSPSPLGIAGHPAWSIKRSRQTAIALEGSQGG
jgi:hypothetical protein